MQNQLTPQIVDERSPTPRSRSLACTAAAIPAAAIPLAVIVPGAMFGCAGLCVVIALAVVLTVAAISTRSQVGRKQRARLSRWRARRQRESRRLSLLCPLPRIREQEYLLLRYLVENSVDDTDASRFDLQGLLDHFVRIAVAHQRFLDALKIADGFSTAQPPVERLDDGTCVKRADGLSTAGNVIVTSVDVVRSKRGREIRERRIRHRDECREYCVQLSEELTAIGELIRLIVQRIQLPMADSEDDCEIERRLWELDEVDAALKELTAGRPPLAAGHSVVALVSG